MGKSKRPRKRKKQSQLQRERLSKKELRQRGQAWKRLGLMFLHGLRSLEPPEGVRVESSLEPLMGFLEELPPFDVVAAVERGRKALRLPSKRSAPSEEEAAGLFLRDLFMALFTGVSMFIGTSVVVEGSSLGVVDLLSEMGPLQVAALMPLGESRMPSTEMHKGETE